MQKSDLIRLATQRMPFGKYKNCVIIDLPEEYLLWFARKGFPEGEIGRLMAIALELKIEGLDYLVKNSNTTK